MSGRMCSRCGGTGKEPSKHRHASTEPIHWRTCLHCEARYDGGNPFAAYHHFYGECVADRCQREQER